MAGTTAGSKEKAATRESAKASPGKEAVAAPPKKFFHYRDENGRDVVVDSMDLVPESQRALTREINDRTIPVAPGTAKSGGAGSASSGGGGSVTVVATPEPGKPAASGGAMDIHGPSVLLGMLVSLAGALVWQVAQGTGLRGAVKLVMVMVLGAALMMGYVVLLRQQLEGVRSAQKQMLLHTAPPANIPTGDP